MTERIQRNESTPNGKRIWEAVDRGAERAPQKVIDRLNSQRPQQQHDHTRDVRRGEE